MKRMLVLLAALIGLAACGTAQTNTVTTTIASENSQSNHIIYTYDGYDLNTKWTDSATSISFSGTNASIKGSGATTNQGKVTITQGGVYVLSGQYTGILVVNVPNNQLVHLIFNGVSLESSQGSALQINQAQKVIITLAEKTTNKVANPSIYADQQNREWDAAIYSLTDLTLNGSGTLEVTGNYKDGIYSEKMLVLVSGTYNIKAENDGLKGKEAVIIRKINLTIRANGEGIASTDKTGAGKGVILIEDGVFDIVVQKDAVQSETMTELINGTFTIQTTGDISADVNARAFKSDGTIYIVGGTYNLNVTDDGVNAFDIDISNGTLLISAGDDAIHADNKLTISGGDITVETSFEGLEGTTIVLSGGKLKIFSIDDPINAATDLANVKPTLTISGGDIHLTSEGDGLDVNGDFFMTGGTLTIFGSPNAENMVIDYDHLFKVTGGTLYGAGIIGIVGDAPIELIHTEYHQPTITVPITTQAGGTTVAIVDQAGNEVLNMTPPYNYRYVIMSSPKLEAGQTYSIYVNGQFFFSTQAFISNP